MKIWYGFCLVLLLFARFTLAQTENTIELNENVMGEITLHQSSQVYRFTNGINEFPLIIRASSLNEDFAPVLVLYDSQERRMARASNPIGLLERQLTFTPQTNADYFIQVLGVDGGQGEYVLTVLQQPYTPTLPFIELRENYNFQDRVTVDEPFKSYQITASPTQTLILDITTEGSAVVVSDESGHIYGTARQNFPHSSFSVPPSSSAIYYVTIYHSGIERREPFTIRLMSDAATSE